MLNAKECAILGAISERTIHGYELIRTLRQRGYEEWTEISLPSVYRIIRTLESRTYIYGELEEGTQGAPKKRYALTEKGRGELTRSLLEHLAKPIRSRSSFDLGIAHIGQLDRAKARQAIGECLQTLELRHATMQRRRQAQQPLPWNVEALFVHGEQRYLAEAYYLKYVLRRLEEG